MDPRFAAAAAAFDAQREEEGVRLLTQALGAAPGPVGAYRVLTIRLLGRRDHPQAEHWARSGLGLFPDDLELWNLLGIALRRQVRLEEALAALEKASALGPDRVLPLVNRLNVLNDLKDGARGLPVAQRLIGLQPDNPEHHRGLGAVYKNLNRLEDAIAALEHAVRLKPGLVEAWLDMVGIVSGLQDHDRAIALLERAMAAAPRDRRLLEGQAVLLRRAGRRDEAMALLRKVIAEADAAWAHHQLGLTLKGAAMAGASTHLARAVELEPNNLVYRLDLVEGQGPPVAGQEGRNLQEAHDILQRARLAGPLPPEILRVERQVSISIMVADYAALESLGTFRDYGRGLAKEGLHAPLFGQLGRVQTAEDRFELLRQHRLWGELVEAQAALHPIRRRPVRPRGSCIRVGFMSSDLRNHAVSYFAYPLFEHIDRSRFDVYCYSFFNGHDDEIQRYITGQVSAFRWRPNISSRAAAQMIADDQLDILFELGGSTHMNKLDVMAYRPAPLQASWLGYPHSAGLEAIDYLVVDPYIKPPNPDLLIEKPMVMPRSWISLGRAVFRDDQFIDPVIPETRNGMITFGTANNPHKYGPRMLRTWAKVVARVPGSRFLFVRPEGGARSFRENIRALFAEEGVATDRIRFEAISGAHLPFYNEIDIALDTFPLTGGTTTCETLWMGVPVVAMLGEAFFERLSYSILTNVGLGDLVATSPEGFVDIAVKLAADPARRQRLRTDLRAQIKASPLGQHEQFAKDFYDLVASTVGLG